MDEGRLGVVMRQEERHRKFVYMMNDIVRAQLGLYTNCLKREQHEASVKLVSSCVEVRRSIVRLDVLRKCLEMRKRKVLTRDSVARFGQYGGKPLWAMSRDIERVIADNHPRIRRIRHAQEMMRKSLESGAVLDEEAMARRMDAFFQMKQGRQQQKKSVTGDAPSDVFGTSSPRKTFKLPPIVARPADRSQNHENSQATLRQDSQNELTRRRKNPRSGVPAPSLETDSKGRLVGIGRTSQAHSSAGTTEKQDKEADKTSAEADDRVQNHAEAAEVCLSRLSLNDPDKDEETATKDRGEGAKDQQDSAEEDAAVKVGKDRVKQSKVSEKDRAEGREPKQRSTLILPPLETSKALVTRT